MSPIIEEGIRPLVESLNGVPFIRTIYSCEGHFEREPDPKYLPTAYVTFGVDDVERFQFLYADFLKMSERIKHGSITLRYDCILGRFTLSAWAGNGAIDPQRKRRVVSGLVLHLSDLVLAHKVSSGAGQASSSGSSYDYPCRSHIPPCALIIPIESSLCPFESPPAKVSRFSVHA